MSFNILSFGGVLGLPLLDQASLPTMYKKLIKSAYMILIVLVELMLILFIFEFLKEKDFDFELLEEILPIFEQQLVNNSAYFLSGTKLYYILHYIVVINVAITFSLIFFQFNELIAGRAHVEGFAFFIPSISASKSAPEQSTSKYSES